MQTSTNWGPNSRFILEVVFKPLIHCKSRLWCVNLNTQIMTIDLRQVLTQVIFELASFWRIAIAGRVIHRNLCHCTFLQSNSFVLVRMSQFIFRFLHKVFNLKLQKQASNKMTRQKYYKNYYIWGILIAIIKVQDTFLL